ncbi:hypothetical protein VUR80DRAFT_2998 [Thermomyces stellatus]
MKHHEPREKQRLHHCLAVWPAHGGTSEITMTSEIGTHRAVVQPVDLRHDLEPQTVLSASLLYGRESADGLTRGGMINSCCNAHKSLMQCCCMTCQWGPQMMRYKRRTDRGKETAVRFDISRVGTSKRVELPRQKNFDKNELFDGLVWARENQSQVASFSLRRRARRHGGPTRGEALSYGLWTANTRSLSCEVPGSR